MIKKNLYVGLLGTTSQFYAKIQLNSLGVKTHPGVFPGMWIVNLIKYCCLITTQMRRSIDDFRYKMYSGIDSQIFQKKRLVAPVESKIAIFQSEIRNPDSKNTPGCNIKANVPTLIFHKNRRADPRSP